MGERMKIDWKTVVVGSMIGVVSLGGCTDANRQREASDRDSQANLSDPAARSFDGTIVSLRPMTSTMLISKNEKYSPEAVPNIISVRYTPETRFLLDGHDTTLDELQQYMVVHISGHMRDGQLYAQTADFSSILPHNVRPAPAGNGVGSVIPVQPPMVLPGQQSGAR